MHAIHPVKMPGYISLVVLRMILEEPADEDNHTHLFSISARSQKTPELACESVEVMVKLEAPQDASLQNFPLLLG